MSTAEARLFSPLPIRGVTLPNRIVVSPMCQYSCDDGFASDWHLVHLGSRAVGGAGLIFTEAAAVEGRGRISPQDLGIWKDEHIEPLARIVRFVKQQGSRIGIQLAHAGRKGSTAAPGRGKGAVASGAGGWVPVAPSAIAFDSAFPMPAELSIAEIHGITKAFQDAAKRALQAGFDVIELHGAHGYLINEFMSPLSNKRMDEYGGSFENRIRFAREVIEGLREVLPDSVPLLLRISAIDWAEGGWTIADSVALARVVKPLGVDLIDCSSGGLVHDAVISTGPGYQVPFAERIRKETGILTGAVGMITEPKQAEEILRQGSADFVFLARVSARTVLADSGGPGT